MEQVRPLDKVFVRRVRCKGRHGCNEEEKNEEKWFEVDVVAEGDFSEAGQKDSLEYTVDYEKIRNTVTRTITSHKSRNTLEYLARQIASRVMRLHKSLERVTVTICKPDRFGGNGYPGLESTYLRSDFY